MPAEDIEADFPNLCNAYAITSEEDSNYNCIAWAAGDNTRWWDASPYPGYYWPDGVPRDGTNADLLLLFHQQGFRPCKGEELEADFEKVAIYGNGTFYEHAARQLRTGRWASKLGPDEDIEHDKLEGLTGREYGKVVYILKRPITPQESGNATKQTINA